MDNKSKTVIIKKIKKGHAGAHGGSWKVAYADFVTAMMAFFLLMWLLSMTSDEKRVRLAEYFKSFSIFEQSGTSFLEQTSHIKQESGGDIKAEKEKTTGQMEITPADLAEKLKRAVKEKLSGLENQVLIELADDGVRIQIIDPDGTLFLAGSSEPTPKLRSILKVVGDNIKGMGNMIALEGHTDSSPYRVGKNTNWELSSQRASAARYLLGEFGIDPDRVSRVVGFSDKHPYIQKDPKDPRNRRISILIMQNKIEKPVEPSVAQPTAPAPPGLNIIEPKLSPEERERHLKEIQKEKEEKAGLQEKPKNEANKPKEVIKPQPSGSALKTAPFQPIVPKAETQKGTNSKEKPSGMQIIEPGTPSGQH